MKQLPLPVRIAAGLAVTAVERARLLPQQLAGLPVTVVSEALQLSMRLQQQVTELAIKGDDVLSGMRPPEEEPEWATFDEDESTLVTPVPVRVAPVETPEETPVDDDPWTEEERAIAAEPPAALPVYDELSLPKLRARLRVLSVEDLEELLAYERAHDDRPQFTGMLNRRIATVRAQP
ncbi:lipid droplet-associated protein [Umezawaea sp. Da 62-37]|uniref:lipid droplet-associated protein n=1 Tax=Umezawaea sp. Da 62-37 TaxID=3075927 RepID=UPI0028F723D4|nr:lipid droplet-associated protein [Umezawaea sp. Da 62-37]WNV82359.1 lipid droplet-associated protein [Umezawaea sp. Da 62-37]